MKTIRRILTSFVFAASMVISQAQTYTVAALANLPSSSYAPNSARSLNNSGQACGAARDSSGVQKPVLWTSPSTAVDLGLLDVYAGAAGEAVGLNNNGAVVGYSSVRVNGTPQSHAFLWQSGTLTDITPAGWLYAFAFSVNDNNVVLGSGSVNGYGAKLFTYNIATSTYTYYTVPTDTVAQRGTLNQSGIATAAVGTWSYPDITPIWNSSAGTSFNIAQGGYLAYAYRMNNNGQICGGRYNTSTGVMTAFVWTPSGVNGTTGWTTDLGKPYNAGYSVARGINSFGYVVGGTDPSPSFGFLWTGGGSLVNLNTLVPSGSLSIRDAHDINDKQQILASTFSGSVWGFAVLTRS